MDDVQQQLDRLEWRLDLQEDKIRSLKDTADNLKDNLNTINKSLLQIKWFVVGGVICWLSEQLGLLGILKLMGV